MIPRSTLFKLHVRNIRRGRPHGRPAAPWLYSITRRSALSTDASAIANRLPSMPARLFTKIPSSMSGWYLKGPQIQAERETGLISSVFRKREACWHWLRRKSTQSIPWARCMDQTRASLAFLIASTATASNMTAPLATSCQNELNSSLNIPISVASYTISAEIVPAPARWE